jgi:diguanylate cyclase (GGDEF)-like protein/PAS domain S-box-containing protein
MINLTLRQRMLIGPITGLVLIFALTLTYQWYAEKHNALLKKIVDVDVAQLDRYTDLFTGLSRHHMALYALLYDAPTLDEGIIYERGRKILDEIDLTTEAIAKLTKENKGGHGLHALNPEEVGLLLDHLDAYRSSAISAIEMTSVALNLAADYLLTANQHFSYMHENFANRLDAARRDMHTAVDANIELNSWQTRIIAVIGLSISGVVLLFALVSSSRVSHNLQTQITALNELSSSGKEGDHDARGDEIERMHDAIEQFLRSLETVREQDRSLAAKNEALLREIQVRAGAEQALTKAKGELEEKVLERTHSLMEANGALSEEIDQRRKAETRLFIYKQVIENTDEAVLITDRDARVIEVNPAYEAKLGYSREEIIGGHPGLVKSGLHDQDFYRGMWAELRGKKQWSGEIWNKHKQGEIVPFWLTINAILDEKGEVAHYIGLFRDISALKQAEENLEQLAYYDTLTGLPNRALFNDRLSQTIINAKRHECHLAVMFVDLDRFKDVNDSLGHSIGDSLLVEVANRLRSELRSGDTVSRLGGDEFMLILPEIKRGEDAISIARKVIRVLREPFTIAGHHIAIGGSVGIALYPEHGSDAERLKKCADSAMYQAKGLGRNRYQLYSEALQKESIERMALVEDIRSALTDDQFELFYQPIINLGSGVVHEVEALIRWRRGGENWVSPGEFIPVAEEHGLIGEIDRWVLGRACEFAARSPGHLMVHVNLSAGLFQNTKTPRMVANCLKQSGLEAARLCLEITETAVIADPSTAQGILESINEMGVCVALDDFGTGYSSLTHLTRFPLQRLKVDRSFVNSLLDDAATKAVVQSMLELARNMNISVVAEGVEMSKQHDFLVVMGCDYGQGFYYGRPMSEPDLRQWLASWESSCPDGSAGA